ncbi:MAG: PAS domain S-box protein [Candidatus Edwardsbacteria bacterium]|nr:PAS domain S-box protein [Candidatus Edwardsbacteria bacterium]MBU1576318.1 PAS domain S-box protein [Candidatus Edwardsbacteria bacterium]MBU2463247.1 PAS domain S-box protein [Candidatus Edwardsbacteria bacterium]MBU2593931.1 PAS domain S-box protein [Candidatus Edwardsbacteria bacterium]
MIRKNSKVKKVKPASTSRAVSKTAKADEILRCPEIVLDNISDSIIQLDLQNRVIWTNKAAAVTLGREPKDIVGKLCYKLWGRASSDCQDCPTVLARKSGVIQTKEMASKDGRIWQVSSHPVKDGKGKVVSVVEVSRDITESKRALEQETKRLLDKGAISETALQLAKTSDEEQIFKLISQGIHKLAGNAVATVSSFDSSDSTLTLREIAGSPASLKKISEVLGKNTGPLKLQNIPPRVIKKFRMGRLITLAGGLTEVFLDNLPSRMINALSSGLGIQQVYGMGLYCGQNILGTIIICQLDKRAGLNQDLIENFINQAAMALSRVKAEKEIKYSQDYFKAIIDNTSEIITILDSDGIIKFKSLSAAHELGYQPEQLIGRNVFDFIHPEDVPGLIAKFNQELLNTGKKVRLELRFKHKDGTWQTLDATSINLLDNPSVNGLVISSRNITQRKKNELALKQSGAVLKESQRKLETLMGNLPGMVYRCRNDRDWTMEITNDACRDLTGYDPADIIANKTVSFAQLIHPADREMVWSDIQIAVQKKKAYQLIYRIIARDGTEKWVWEQGLGVFDEKGILQALEGFITDISERKRAEDALHTSEYQYRSTIDSLADSIHVVDAKLSIMLTNRVFKEWNKKMGLASEAVGRNIFDIYPYLPKDAVSKEYQAVFQTGKVLATVEENSINNSQVVTETRKIPVFENDKVIRVTTVVRDITARKLAEAKLKESEANYRQIFDGVAEGIYRSTPEGKVLLVNPALARMLGHSSVEEALKRDIQREGYLDAKTRRQFIDLIEKNGYVKDLVSQWRRQDGSELTLKENAHAVKDPSGKTLYYEGTVEDITEQIRAEEEILSSEMKYRMLMDQANDAIFVGDPETGRLVDANLKAQQLIGRTLDEILKMDQSALHPADQKERYRDIFRQHIKDGKAIEHDLFVVHKDGRLIPVEISANLVEIRGRKLLQGIFHDLSERQGMESALKESEEKYRQIFEGISEGIYRSTPDGKLLFANPSLIRMLGYENPEDVQGLDINHSVYLDKKTRERFIKQIEQTGEVTGFESELVSKDGTVLAVSENARLVKDESGKALYYEGTLEDVTVRKRAELSLKSEKDKLEHLFKVGLSVARAQTLQEKLDLTMKGIADCRLFRKAVIVLEDNGYRSHIAQYGLQPEEVENIEKSPVNDDQHKSKIFLDKYRRSNSYFIPHADAEIHKYFAARFVSQDYKSNGTWHREDVLIVPLAIKGTNVGYLSVDEPWDGNIPAIETVHLLELFANQAAIAIENIRLYNDLERSYYDTLKAFVAAMDAKDPYTKGHSENVRHYALKIARHIGLPEDRLRLIDYSSLLHDIGKLGIREDILAKPDVLSTAEFQEVKLHPVIGSRLVLEIDALSQTGDVIYCHHEYYDGSGYPRGIKGDDIPLEARIIAVADAFEAMTSDRPYRKAFSFQVALQRLQDAAGTQFDHKIVNAFTELFRRESGIGEGQ